MAAEIIELFPKSEDSLVSLSFKMGICAGKMELWNQLPLEWKTSAKGIELFENNKTESDLVQREAEQQLKLLNKE